MFLAEDNSSKSNQSGERDQTETENGGENEPRSANAGHCEGTHPTTTGKHVIETDINYCSGGSVELALDLARPSDDAKGPFPALIMIHGGNWRAGNREGYRQIIEKAADQGYVAIAIEYRLNLSGGGPYQVGAIFPAPLEDVKCAARWLRAQAKKYGINPSCIGAMGADAGAHLAMMLAFTSDISEFEGIGGHAEESSAVEAVAQFYGSSDLAAHHAETTNPFTKTYIENLIGNSPVNSPELYIKASPVTYIDQKDPPVFSSHGANDTVYPKNQTSKYLDEKLQTAGVSHTLRIENNLSQGYLGLPNGAQALDAAFSFLDENLKGSK